MPGATRTEQHEDDGVFWLHTEELSVDRREVVTGRVRVATVVSERQELVDELLARRSVEIERIPRGEAVAAAPPIREEGDVIVIPVLEEILVIERRLILKEEIRVRRVESRERLQETVTLRSEDVVVSREPAAALEERTPRVPGTAAHSKSNGE